MTISSKAIKPCAKPLDFTGDFDMLDILVPVFRHT